MPAGPRCPRCGGYEWDSEDRCLGMGCGHHMKPAGAPVWWGGQNWQPHQEPPPRPIGPVAPPPLYTCPSCKQVSLFWDPGMSLYNCLNLSCRRWFAREEIGG